MTRHSFPNKLLFGSTPCLKRLPRQPDGKYYKSDKHLQAELLPLYMATVSEGHIEWCEVMNVSLNSSCLRLQSHLALTAALNHTHTHTPAHPHTQTLSALPESLWYPPPSLPSWFLRVLGCCSYLSGLTGFSQDPWAQISSVPNHDLGLGTEKHPLALCGLTYETTDGNVNCITYRQGKERHK